MRLDLEHALLVGRQLDGRGLPGVQRLLDVEAVDVHLVVDVSVRDGKVAPKPHRVDVKLGANVRLQVTSDEDDVLHVHGYDVEEPLEAGHTTTVELTADQPGVFEVETHESELLLLQLAVR